MVAMSVKSGAVERSRVQPSTIERSRRQCAPIRFERLASRGMAQASRRYPAGYPRSPRIPTPPFSRLFVPEWICHGRNQRPVKRAGVPLWEGYAEESPSTLSGALGPGVWGDEHLATMMPGRGGA